MRPNLARFNMCSYRNSLVSGFTLIETVIGIVVLSIAFSVLITLIYPMTEQSADQLHQIKAAELGQSMLNEIQQKAFDENSDKTGGLIRCGETSAPACSTIMGSEGETRGTYDDVDDYNEINHGNDIENSLNDHSLDALYIGYSVDVTVCNDGDYNGQCDATTNIAKLITVTVKTPTGFDIVFSTYRANF
ncbi:MULTISPECIES: prepilin-type N-terminal cleavage/methylation domain-containing protein [Thalassotalea]|uniref:Prepilin-type N-terminal cleavage/methylation domain-containing protein n=1 Tax=Thalassotalea castellviae TaxID=3075612 RepID=A0ABU2ZZF5_9GAMM|nr:prepilin-type N-terminal cleavage/methylation domain-containing protein [Thalassotalea sp. W431]MDT0603309.1 prepilin-type N-terminal cleavage/methylation domain-containing protein [Thalassotalea sp. W431]